MAEYRLLTYCSFHGIFSWLSLGMHASAVQFISLIHLYESVFKSVLDLQDFNFVIKYMSLVI